MSNEPLIAFDTETHDPKLNTHGPGFLRGDAFIAGVSVAVPGFSTYIPIGHSHGNCEDITSSIKWLGHILKAPNKKLAANIHYDLDALASIGVNVRGDFHDVQVIDALIDEELQGYRLEDIARRRLGEGKLTKQLKDVLKDHKAGWSQLWQLDPALVAGYAIQDAELLLDINDSQNSDIARDELSLAQDVEVDLTKVLWKMHRKGVRVDVEKAQSISKMWSDEAQSYLDKAARCGFHAGYNPNSTKSLSKLAESLSLVVPRTENDNPSITNEWMRDCGEEVFRHIYDYKRINKIRRDFIDGVFLEYEIDGRIHPQWFQSRSTKEGTDEDAGARTGRITGQKPNLTQIPARDPVLGPLCRSCVLPEEGEQYIKADFSSQEPRLLLNYAYITSCRGSQQARDQFIKNPRTDYHQMTADLISSVVGYEFGRSPAKTINLGIAYGMGKYKLAARLGVSLEEATRLLNGYHRGVPYVKEIADSMMIAARVRGYIKTLNGRRRHFKKWESPVWEEKGLYKSEEECRDVWGKAQRAECHKALNAAVQGSAADQMKLAIIHLDNEGLTPLIQIYDECGFSGDDAVAKRACEIMENAIPIEIPMIVDPDMGMNWGMQ